MKHVRLFVVAVVTVITMGGSLAQADVTESSVQGTPGPVEFVDRTQAPSTPAISSAAEDQDSPSSVVEGPRLPLITPTLSVSPSDEVTVASVEPCAAETSVRPEPSLSKATRDDRAVATPAGSHPATPSAEIAVLAMMLALAGGAAGLALIRSRGPWLKTDDADGSSTPSS